MNESVETVLLGVLLELLQSDFVGHYERRA
jgi:hypothetical protein